MGLTSTANAVSKLSDLAEKLYTRVEATRKQVQEVTETVDETNRRAAEIEAELAEQRALLEAVAAESGALNDETTDDTADAEATPVDE